MDPFSVATGAAGLVSLGLTVSGGLIQYCRDYQSRDADLAQLSQHAEELESFLTLIEKQTTGPQGPNADIHTALQGCRDASDACLQDFKRLNDKYASSNPGRSRKLVHNLKYPFNKGKFEDIRSRFREFNVALLGHLHDITRGLRVQMISESDRVATAVGVVGRQLQSSISNAEHAIDGTIRDKTDQLEVSFQQNLQKTEDYVTTSVAIGLHSLSESIGKGQEQQTSIVMHRLDQVVQMLQSQNQVQTTNLAMDNRMALSMPRTNNTRQNRNITRTPSSAVSVGDFICDCSTARYRASTIQHKKSCPYYFSNRKKRTLTLKFGALQRQIIATWIVEYSPLAWARDWKIYPNLTFRAVVHRQAPAFQSLIRVRDKIRYGVPILEMASMFQNCLVELQQIFTSGKGWPTDVDPRGGSLFHEALDIFLISNRILFDEEAVILYVQFLTALVRMRVPINDTGIGLDPLQIVLLLLQTHSASPATGIYMVNSLLGMDATISDDIHSSVFAHTIIRCNIIDLYEVLSCTEFLHEILLRSESNVIHLLRNDPSLLYKQTKNRCTPLHLAVRWPRGLSILIEFAGEAIQSIINAADIDDLTALEYAVWLMEPDSVRLLLDAGASIPSTSFHFLDHEDSSARGKTIARIIIESLALQRRKLLKIALRHLSPEGIEELGLKENLLLDHEAFDVAQALRQQEVPIPAIYDSLKPGSVYHWRKITPFIAQILFDTGFQQTNAKLSGYTPLMTLWTNRGYAHNFACMVSWFESHGADLDAPIPIPQGHDLTSSGEGTVLAYPTRHRISYELGLRADFYERKQNIPAELPPIFSKLLKDKFTDPCRCYCTVNGCTSATKYVKGFCDRNCWPRNFRLCTWKSGINDGRLMVWRRLAERITSDSDALTTTMKLIRSITFDELGMRHTCCNYRQPLGLRGDITNGLLLMDPAEVDEIREEDRYLADLLDALMSEFETKILEMKVPLSQFMKEYWWPRMSEVEKERDEISAGDLHAMREIGVVLDESC